MKMTQMDKVSKSRVGASMETRTLLDTSINTLLEMVRIYWVSMFLRKMQKCTQTKYYAGYDSSKANVSPE